MKAAIVIPAFNEQAAIGSVVKTVQAYGTPIVVDDGSSDDTAAYAKAAGATIVRHTANRGYDAALASGFAQALGMEMDVIVTLDADGQLDHRAIPLAIAAVADGAAMALGRRPRAARLGEVLFNTYSRLRFGVPDILCGLKAFRADVYAPLQARMNDRSVYTSLALALLRRKQPFVVVDVAVRPRDGASRFGGAWRGNLRILGALARALADDVRRR